LREGPSISAGATAPGFPTSGRFRGRSAMQPEPPPSAMRAGASRIGPLTGPLPHGRPHVPKTPLSAANHKHGKGFGYRSGGLVLPPRATAHAGRNLCPFATPGCARSCFADFDRLAWPQVKRAAVARTLLLSRRPDWFETVLRADLAREHAAAGRAG